MTNITTQERAYALFQEYLDWLINDPAAAMDSNIDCGFVDTHYGVCGALQFNDGRGHIYVTAVFEDIDFYITLTDETAPRCFRLGIDETAELLEAVADFIEV